MEATKSFDSYFFLNFQSVILTKFVKTFCICTSKGTMTISNTKETVQNTARGTRKVTSIMEETVVLPKYLAEHKMLDKIESVVEGQFLVISYPLEQAAIEKESPKPVKINIKVQRS